VDYNNMFGVTYRIRRNKNIWEVWRSTLLSARRVAWALTERDAQAILNRLAQNDQGAEA